MGNMADVKGFSR